MNITVNGERVLVAGALTLEQLIGNMKLDPRHIVIEHNRLIVPAAAWAKTMLVENDLVEIVSFVGGG